LRGGNLIRNCAACGAALCAAGWLLRAEWPGVKAFWYFSQFGMTAPYPVYAAGLCFFTVLAFHLICDRAGFQFPLLTIMGKNPLVLYLLQAALVLVIKVAVPSSLPAWAALAVFAAVLGACYTLAWWLDHKGKIIKV
ncbi:MAG: hypothetical protein GX580_00605, partial [Candidatus Hydrogenedens sp.]|nr:hypothetical protein [Candidatus Hydrogenedens sp.]